ncbi:hypothetical protein [Microbacterium sp. 1.5R]|uniref:hypothetical protein n=1 Tax=Microbacterium sp. 1.5R TaxID=1916917 RepID=UPI0011AA1583|nr:hypothetical protein [Microbacterium sp. 1.5R]
MFSTARTKVLAGALIAASLAGFGAVGSAAPAHAAKNYITTTYFTGTNALNSCNSTATNLSRNGYFIHRSCYAVKSTGSHAAYGLQYYRA